MIVTGVLTALALENWNGAYQERRLEREYLAALADDVRAHVAHYDGWIEKLNEHQGWTAAIWGWANGATPRQPNDEVLLWMRLGGQINLNTLFQDGAYQDLLNSGKLILIRQRDLREAIINYHHGLERWNAIIDANGSRAAEQYNAAVAGLILPELAWRAAMKEDLSSDDLSSILREFRARSDVRYALVALAESHEFRAGAAERNRSQAVELLKQLERELAR